MMKLQQSVRCLSLPFLLGAAVWPLSAAPQALPKVQDVPASLLAKAWNSRAKAKMLASRGQWPQAASQWRLVLLELHRSERLVSLGTPARPNIEAMRHEAEHEMRFAQSQLGAFWKVRDLVTPGVDSSNPTPAMAANVLAEQPIPQSAQSKKPSRVSSRTSTVLSSAAMSAPLLHRPLPTPRLQNELFAATPKTKAHFVNRASSRSARAHEVFLQGLMLGKTGRRESHGAAASMRWARSQWWTRPMVQRAADSRNPMLLSLPSKSQTLSLGRVAISRSGSYRASAVLSPAKQLPPRLPVPPTVLEAPEMLRRQVENWAAGTPPLESQNSRRWTMQILLPSAAEATLAARGARFARP